MIAKPALELTPEERGILLRLARDSIAARFSGAPRPPLPDGPDFERPAGAFVSLHGPGHRLRGCIGRMMASSGLAAVVRDMAEAAAFEDPRFPPLSSNELEGLDLEVTILSPLWKGDIGEIVVGRHGVHLSARGRAAVFLPQVAVEQGWDREELLQNLCAKAGLPSDAWRDPGAEFMLFEGLVFGEKDQTG